jgi:hypothetical protein
MLIFVLIALYFIFVIVFVIIPLISFEIKCRKAPQGFRVHSLEEAYLLPPDTKICMVIDGKLEQIDLKNPSPKLQKLISNMQNSNASYKPSNSRISNIAKKLIQAQED